MSRTINSAFAALMLAAAFAPAALAQATKEPASIKVAYGDLNMSTSSGGEMLLKRIQSAARSVCREAVPHSPLTPRAITLCHRDTVGQTVREMGIATLTAAWARDPATVLAAR